VKLISICNIDLFQPLEPAVTILLTSDWNVIRNNYNYF